MVLLFLTICILSAFFSSCKPQRIIESSQRHRPDWVFGMERGYIIGRGTDNNISAAQSRAMMDIRRQISEAIYNELVSRSRLTTREIRNDNTFKIISGFTSEVVSITRDGMSINGISPGNASDYFYEMRYDRKTGRTQALYAIKYPFSRFELERLFAEWNKRQHKLLAEKQEIRNKLGKHESIEDLFSDVYKLLLIQEELIPEHRIKVDILLADIYNYLNSLEFKIIEETDSHIKFSLQNHDGSIKFHTRPVISSDDLLIESIFMQDEYWVVKFREQPKNGSLVRIPQIQILLTMGNWELRQSHTLNPEVELNLISPIELKALRFSFWGSEVRVYECSIQTQLDGLGEVILERLIIHPVKTLNSKRYELPAIHIEFTDGLRVGKGRSFCSFKISQALNRMDYSSNDGSRTAVRGTVYYRERLTGERKTKNFSGIQLTTNW